MIDYLSNLPLKDDGKRAREYAKLQKHFGYLPIYGPTIEDVRYGKQLLGHIVSEYPGYKWVVEVRDTVITVVNETLAINWGFRLREKMLDNDGKVIKQFAGKLLEAFYLKRAGHDPAEMAGLKKNARGEYQRAI